MATAERKATVGKGVNLTVTDTKIIITIDVTQDFGPSTTGKNIIVASTSGNVRLSNGVTLGLNAYRPLA